MQKDNTFVELLRSQGIVVITFVALTLTSVAMNRAVIAYGPQEVVLSTLIYGPFSKSAGAAGFMFLLIGCLLLMRRQWVQVLPMVIVGSALLLFSYDISLNMALASRPNEIPSMIAADRGCVPNRLTEALDKLGISKPDSVPFCSELCAL